MNSLLLKSIIWLYIICINYSIIRKYDLNVYYLFILSIYAIVLYVDLSCIKSLRDDFTYIIISLYYFISLNIHAAFAIFPSNYEVIYTSRASTFLAQTSISTNLIIASIHLITLPIFKRNSYNYYAFFKKRFWNNKRCYYVLAISFLVILASKDLYKMGQGVYVELPLHLTALFMHLRFRILPAVFFLVFFGAQNSSFNKESIIILFLWFFDCLFDAASLLSKSSIIRGFLPFLFITLQYQFKNTKRLLIMVGVILVVTLGLYIIIPTIRYSNEIDTTRFRDELAYIEYNDMLIQILNRSFPDGINLIKSFGSTNNDILFDTKNVKTIIDLGGSEVFVTAVLDENDNLDRHSSGTTGLCDALLWGGRGAAFVYLVFIVVFSKAIDSNIMSLNPLSCTLLTTFAFDIAKGKSISLLIQKMTAPIILILVLSIILSEKTMNLDQRKA